MVVDSGSIAVVNVVDKDPAAGVGTILLLTQQQRANRARYVGGQLPLSALDAFIRKEGAPEMCPAGYYREPFPNGGFDPCAPDPFARWSFPGKTFVNVTCECIAAAMWIQGVSRKCPDHFPLWGGRMNCDSIRMEAATTARCWLRLERPEVGCVIVYGSVDQDRDGQRDRTGHIMVATEVPAEFDPRYRECWAAIRGVDVAARGEHRANMPTTGIGWFGADRYGPKDSWFLRCVMKP
ncbi:MAG: hypothetical protein AB7O24_01130 [Kofleriaceae bacterium]